MKLCTALLLSCLAACGYSNSSGSQSSPPTSWFETEPVGATLLLVDRNLTLRTPAELGFEIAVDEPLEVSHRDCATWRGTLADVPRTAARSYRLVLQPK